MTGLFAGRRFSMLGVVAVALTVASCGGSNGSDGEQGPAGPQGSFGQACWDLNNNGIGDLPDEDTNGDGVVDVNDCRSPIAGAGTDLGSPLAIERLLAAGEPIVVEITEASVASPPILELNVTDSAGNGLSNLEAAASISCTMNKLLPPANGFPAQWQSYINEFEVAREGTQSPNLLQQALQAEAEGGTLIDNGDGTYTFTYTTDITNVTEPVDVAYEPGLTHRAGCEVRFEEASALNPDNPTMDFVPDGGMGSGDKSIADTASCNSCHDRLAFHGGGRFTADYCVTCHSPGTRDQDYGELLDMGPMTHSLHAAAVRRDQESTEGEYSFIVYGFGENFNAPPDDFSEVTYPQTTLYCENCHEASEDTPDGNAWLETATAETCGGCHVSGLKSTDPDPVTGISSYSYLHVGENGPTGVEVPSGSCLNCHGSAGFVSNLEVHQKGDRLSRELGEGLFALEILSAENTGPGETPTVTIRVTNPEDGTAYDILNDPEFGENGAMDIYMAWTTADYYNGDELGNSVPSGNGQPIRLRLADIKANGTANADGSLSVLSPIALPADYTGDLGVSLGSRPDVDGVRAYARSVTFFPASERESVVDIARCDSCHEYLSFHGGNRNDDVGTCLTCHNADASSSGGTSISLLYLGHAIHAAQGDFEEVTYPGRISNCTACHVDDSFYQARSTARAVSTSGGASSAVWTDDLATTATTFACSTCHTDSQSSAHMQQNGGQVDVQKGDIGNPPVGQETCSICHGPGRVADVAEAHNVDLD